MKKILIKITIFLSLVTFGNTVSAATCGAKFMEDPCSLDGYSIVDTERFVHGKHNWIHDVHYFGAKRRVARVKRVVHKKRVHSRNAYRYIKRCRIVKIRR